MNIKRLSDARDRLVHIVPDLKLSGSLCLALRLAVELRKQYHHTLLFETPIETADAELCYQAQGFGMDTVQVDAITPELLESQGFTGAIAYNVTGHPGIARVIPTLYYSYGEYDASSAAGSLVIPCSRYACTFTRYGRFYTGMELDPQMVIPPMVPTRDWRRMKATPHPFTVGIITSGAYDKYPCRVVMELMSKLPKDVAVLLTSLPKYKNFGTQLAIDARKAEYKNTITCSPIFGATLRYLVSCDVLVYASADDHQEPYGRLVVEAMALGKPVICENRGVFTETLDHGVNAFLFNNTDDITEHINRIRKDRGMAELLGANAQMWASWQDTTVHIGKLKRVLRAIGV